MRKVMIITILRTEEKALSRKEIIESVRDSLENLQLEYIDLLVNVINIVFANTNISSITISLLKHDIFPKVIHKNDPHCPLEGEHWAVAHHLITLPQIIQHSYTVELLQIAEFISPVKKQQNPELYCSYIFAAEVLRAITYLVNTGKVRNPLKNIFSFVQSWQV